MNRMTEVVVKSYHARLGAYRGLECGMIIHPVGGTEVYLDGAVRCRAPLIRDHPGPRAVLNALGRLADGYEGDIRHMNGEIEVKQGQFKNYESRLDRPFEHEEYASRLAELRNHLKMGLSEHPPERSTPVAEVAERIKILREANTVEVAPVRAGARKATRAERPVTSRIRERRAEAGEVEAKTVGVEPEPPTTVIETKVDHRQAVTRQRQGVGRQMSLF